MMYVMANEMGNEINLELNFKLVYKCLSVDNNETYVNQYIIQRS